MTAGQRGSGFILRWIGVGVTLDMALIAGLWCMLDAVSPVTPLEGVFLGVPALFAVARLVHILILPAMFSGAASSRVAFGIETLAVVAMGSAAAFFVGCMAFSLLALIFIALLFLPGWRDVAAATPDVLGRETGVVMFAIPAGVGGLVTGFVEHVFRQDVIRPPAGQEAHPPFGSIHFRTDLLGGAAMGFVSLAFPMIWQQLVGVLDPPDRLTLSLAIVTGLSALLPHLLLLAWTAGSPAA